MAVRIDLSEHGADGGATIVGVEVERLFPIRLCERRGVR